MSKALSILFYTKVSKTTKSGEVPLYMRIQMAGEKRFEISIKRYINQTDWSMALHKMKGNSPEAKSINSYLDSLRTFVHDCERDLLKEGIPVTIENIKNRYLGTDKEPKYLIQVFKQHNEDMKALVGKEFTQSTYTRYITSLTHTQNFLKWKYNVNDIDIAKIDYTFIKDYEFYLKTFRNCNNNSTIKYIKNFGKVVRLCIANGWLDYNPFLKYKPKYSEVIRDYLTADELNTMALKEFPAKRMSLVRDIFLFSCYTGLAYADVKKLTKTDIGIGVDGTQWLFTNRTKTKATSNVPLLSPAIAIMNKYQDEPDCIYKNRLLPVLSNQKMNGYLKEISDVCGINKQLTFHCARHTFATTVTLSNGVSIESVSKMLGHKNIKTTQIYAKVLDLKVSQDMKKLQGVWK